MTGIACDYRSINRAELRIERIEANLQLIVEYLQSFGEEPGHMNTILLESSCMAAMHEVSEVSLLIRGKLPETEATLD